MHQALDTTLERKTPEHIAFRYQLAGPARRAGAYLIDLLVRALMLLAFTLVTMFTAPDLGPELRGMEMGLVLFVFFLVEWGYFVSFELLAKGKTPGKRMMGLRVIHQEGRPVGVSESVLRNLLRAADLLPVGYALGVATMILDSKFRRLGDLVAQTVVIDEPTTKLTSLVSTKKTKRIPGLLARPVLSLEEKTALSLFVRRLSELSEARASELADLVAPRFAARFFVTDYDSVELLIALYERSEGK